MTDIYVNSTAKTASKVSNGAKLSALKVMFGITTADDTGGIKRLCTLPSTATITKIQVACTAITALSDIDIGIYDTGVAGTVIDADILADGLDVSSASKVLDGLTTVSVANSIMSIKDLVNTVVAAGTIASDKFVDIAITLKADATTTGNISVLIEYFQ